MSSFFNRAADTVEWDRSPFIQAEIQNAKINVRKSERSRCHDSYDILDFF
jgi:hypothetical protein